MILRCKFHDVCPGYEKGSDCDRPYGKFHRDCFKDLLRLGYIQRQEADRHG
jgi:hypothetical protein